MQRSLRVTIILTALVLFSGRRTASAQPDEAVSLVPENTPSDAETTPQPEPVPPVSHRPPTARAALDQAVAAYEYGDMNLVVESARIVVDGAVPANDADRADALRFLGIGLYLTGRMEGARLAFKELLSLRPQTQLDPTLTRPEVVAFFNQLHREHRAQTLHEERARRPSLAWALLPPFGQFKNGDRTRGWIILGAQSLFLTSAITTKAIATGWRNPDKTYGQCSNGTCDKTNAARRLKTLNHVSVGLLAATYVIGVIDGVIRHGRPPDDLAMKKSRVSLALLPAGAALNVDF